MPTEVTTALNELRNTLEAHAKLDEQHHQENVEKLDCIAREMRAFRMKYEDTLQHVKQQRADAAEMRKVVMEKTVAGLVWAGLIFVGSALWFYFKEKLK